MVLKYLFSTDELILIRMKNQFVFHETKIYIEYMKQTYIIHTITNG